MSESAAHIGIEQKVQNFFKKNPNVKEVFCTEDGQIFTKRGDAQFHSNKLLAKQFQKNQVKFRGTKLFIEKEAAGNVTALTNDAAFNEAKPAPPAPAPPAPAPPAPSGPTEPKSETPPPPAEEED